MLVVVTVGVAGRVAVGLSNRPGSTSEMLDSFRRVVICRVRRGAVGAIACVSVYVVCVSVGGAVVVYVGVGAEVAVGVGAVGAVGVAVENSVGVGAVGLSVLEQMAPSVLEQ